MGASDPFEHTSCTPYANFFLLLPTLCTLLWFPVAPGPCIPACRPRNQVQAYDDSFRICRPCVGACSRRAPAEGASTCVREKSLVHLRPKLSSPSRGRRRIGPRIPRWGGQSLAVVSSARCAAAGRRSTARASSLRPGIISIDTRWIFERNSPDDQTGLQKQCQHHEACERSGASREGGASGASIQQ
jgi:hypothetical protein